MPIQIEDIKDKPTALLKESGVRLVGFTDNEFKQISTKTIVELNGKGKIPSNYLDITDLVFMGVYNATTNTPALSDSVGTNNQYYIVNVPGSQNLGSGILNMKSGDNLIYYDNKWNLISSSDSLIYNNDFDI